MSYVIAALQIIATWFVYLKMGLGGWEAIVPFYSNYVLFKSLYGNGWKMLLLLIPFYNIYVMIKADIDLAHAFGKSTGFGVGLFFLGPIFLCILAFDKNTSYQK
ncbi:MAG: hypothetical protein IJD86_06880 [Clostridia bacterium]|nr:hypothetical protein [Clostridia bacterium]